jgi:hypothetical protein
MVGFISWLVIIGASLNLVALIYLGTKQAPFLTLACGAFGFLLQITMGIGMRDGRNWAKLLYLWAVPISLATLAKQGDPDSILGAFVGLIGYGAFAICLTRPSAAAYFRSVSRSAELAAVSTEESMLPCPNCAHPYRPGDYRADVAVVRCDHCREEITRQL